MTNFHFIIDNVGENTLAEVLNRTIYNNSYCSIATAYFTVSGFQLLEESLKKCTQFRLLLGTEQGSNPLRVTTLDIWRNLDLQTHINNMNNVVDFFSNESVEVRIYLNKFLHAKTYILNHPKPSFKLSQIEDLEDVKTEIVPSRQRPTALSFEGKDDRVKSTVIVGSSNFTYGGLTQNAELNILDPLGKSTTEVLTWFEELWRNSTDIKSDFIQLLRGYSESFPPFLIYAKALWELYKDDLEGIDSIESGSIMELADFQIAGYKSAKRILDSLGGVLISDAPGLGKTYIAGKILEDIAYYNKEPCLIICPAEVEQQIWKPFIKKYNIPIKQIIHTENLGFGIKDGIPKLDPVDYSNYSLILVDESHYFRNPRTGRYAWFQQLMSLPKPTINVKGKTIQVERKVIFITATPVNNSVWDIYWQLKLIFGEKLLDIASGLAIKDIRQYFQNAAENGNNNIYDLVEYVTVRRSRYFLRQYYPHSTLKGRLIKFPERIPLNLTYEWHSEMRNVYSDAAAAIYECRLAPYCLEEYRKGEKDKERLNRNVFLSLLFRILLLKRLESSLWAFRKTLSNLVEMFEVARSTYKNGYIMNMDSLREYFSILQSSNSDDHNTFESIEGLELFDQQLLDTDRIISDLEHDIKKLKRIQHSIPEDIFNLEKVDNKLLSLKSELRNKSKKVILFTAFRDTAIYLYECMRSEQQIIALVTGSESKIYKWGRETNISRAEIINQFSPNSNNFDIDKEEEINILISTDVLSESLNLQDSDSVINYDLPWNPMRLVQRTGRIDRIGSNYNMIKIYNIIPEKGLEEILKLMEKLYTKISETHRSVGLEWSLLGEDPLPIDFSSVQKLRRGNKGEFNQLIDDLEKKMDGIVGFDPQEQLLAIFQILSKEKIERIPDGAGCVTILNQKEQHRKRGFFVSYRRRTNSGLTDRIWRFFPVDDTPIKNKTEIVSQIQFDQSQKAEPRIDEQNLEKLRDARLRIEHEITNIAAERRTIRITGSIRRAFELAKKKGRADIDEFLQKNYKKPAIEQKLRTITYTNEENAIRNLENLLKIFNQKASYDEDTQDHSDNKLHSSDDLLYLELPPIPEEYDSSLELVCWMHIK